jgi:LuxR family transcriptional regulator, maltose regulon positive regulatory protein
VPGAAPEYSPFTVATKTSARDGLDRSAAPSAIVLETKLTRPPVRAEYVARNALIELLREGTARSLTVVTAPPGFGKTTLLAAWAGGEATRTAWLSLDEDDNDPARFLVHAVAALRTIEPEIGTRALAAQGTPGAGLVDVVLPLLLNELVALEQEVVLVLDDYHLITAVEIHEAIAALVERMPSSLRLVLATREDPPLPLGRLRARGQLTELRAGNLRFSDEEANSFLNQTLNLDLSSEDVGRLQARTEGWPAALYLAALSVRGRPDASERIEAFAGDDRHVVDYLTEEVLARQPPELRAFLLRTSILTRLCGPLCDAVTETEGSAAVLAELERVNLLLIPLDGRREWYRYHQLFAELLQHELTRSHAEEVPLLHQRASGWYRDAGLIVEAANHATAAGDVDAAVELVGRYWSFFLDQRQLATVSRWLDALPADRLGDSRMLCFAAAMITSHLGRLDEAERWLERASAAPLATDGPAVPLDALRAWLRMLRGDVDGSIEDARSVIADAGAAAAAVPAQLLLAGALWWTQDLTEVKPLVEDLARRAEAAGFASTRIFALGVAAATELDLQRTDQAEALAQQALELARKTELEEHPFSALARIAAGKVRALRNELETAITEIEQGIRLAERVNAWHVSTYGVLALAEIRHAKREPAEARRLLARARAIIAALPAANGNQFARVGQTEKALRLRPSRQHEPGGAPYWELSERELAVLRLLASKLSQREIAAELYVSFNTVKTHTRAIFRKLGATSRAEAIERARELGLL